MSEYSTSSEEFIVSLLPRLPLELVLRSFAFGSGIFSTFKSVLALEYSLLRFSLPFCIKSVLFLINVGDSEAISCLFVSPLLLEIENLLLLEIEDLLLLEIEDLLLFTSAVPLFLDTAGKLLLVTETPLFLDASVKLIIVVEAPLFLEAAGKLLFVDVELLGSFMGEREFLSFLSPPSRGD